MRLSYVPFTLGIRLINCWDFIQIWYDNKMLSSQWDNDNQHFVYIIVSWYLLGIITRQGFLFSCSCVIRCTCSYCVPFNLHGICLDVTWLLTTSKMFQHHVRTFLHAAGQEINGVVWADRWYFWLPNALKWLPMHDCLISQNMLDIFLEINILSTRFDSGVIGGPGRDFSVQWKIYRFRLIAIASQAGAQYLTY